MILCHYDILRVGGVDDTFTPLVLYKQKFSHTKFYSAWPVIPYTMMKLQDFFRFLCPISMRVLRPKHNFCTAIWRGPCITSKYHLKFCTFPGIKKVQGAKLGPGGYFSP